MANSMPVTIASDQSAIPVTFSGSATDNTQLYSNTIISVGAISGIDTTGYMSIIAQISGTWVGELIFEGSNDNSTWTQLLNMPVNEITMDDVINQNGIVQVKSTSKYIRLNVTQLVSGSIVVLIFGRTVAGVSAADRLSYAMDRNNNLPLYVQETASKKDLSNALIPSDAPTPIYGFAAATNSVIFNVDTTGYQSVAIQGITVGSGITIQTSNDGITWANLEGFQSATNIYLVTIPNSGMFFFPCSGRFVRGLMSGANFTNVLVYLRQQPIVPLLASGNPMSLQSVAGNAIITGGVSGLLAVAGNIANGVAPTANPNLIGGIDTSGLTRRILTDTSGRLINAATDATNTSRPIGAIPAAAGIQNVAALNVMETSQFEGQSFLELLSQILLELRIIIK